MPKEQLFPNMLQWSKPVIINWGLRAVTFHSQPASKRKQGWPRSNNLAFFLTYKRVNWWNCRAKSYPGLQYWCWESKRRPGCLGSGPWSRGGRQPPGWWVWGGTQRVTLTPSLPGHRSRPAATAVILRGDSTVRCRSGGSKMTDNLFAKKQTYGFGMTKV